MTKLKLEDMPPELLKQLLTFLGYEESSADLTDMEISWERAGREIGQVVLSARLQRLAPEDAGPKPCPRCGKPARLRARNVVREITTLCGPQTLLRNYHHCEECKSGFYPRDIELGLPRDGEYSIEFERRLADFAVNDVYHESAERFEIHYGVSISDNAFRRTVNRLGERLDETDSVTLQSELLEPSPTPAETLYAMVDGSQIPMLHGQWNEAKVGVLFQDAHHLPGNKEQRGQITRARYVAVLGGRDEFEAEFQSALEQEGAKRARRVVWLGDGAPVNWTLCEALCGQWATQILDFAHFVENVNKCGRALLGEQSPYLQHWQAHAERLVFEYDDGVDRLVKELMDVMVQTETDEHLLAIENCIRYLRTNESRMQYKRYRALGLLIGSGPVESAHRHMLQKRMKRAGQHWSLKHGRTMVRLRAAYRTSGPQTFHAAICAAHQKSLLRVRREAQNDAKPANDVSLVKKRRASNR